MMLEPEQRETGSHEPVADRDTAKRLSETLGRAVKVGDRLRENPCVPPHWLAKIQAEEGRPCPRVALMPENYTAAELLGVLVNGDTAPAFAPLAGALLEATGREERVSVLRRIVRTVSRPEIRERLHPKPKEPPARHGRRPRGRD